MDLTLTLTMPVAVKLRGFIRFSNRVGSSLAGMIVSCSWVTGLVGGGSELADYAAVVVGLVQSRRLRRDGLLIVLGVPGRNGVLSYCWRVVILLVWREGLVLLLLLLRHLLLLILRNDLSFGWLTSLGLSELLVLAAIHHEADYESDDEDYSNSCSRSDACFCRCGETAAASLVCYRVTHGPDNVDYRRGRFLLFGFAVFGYCKSWRGGHARHGFPAGGLSAYFAREGPVSAEMGSGIRTWRVRGKKQGGTGVTYTGQHPPDIE